MNGRGLGVGDGPTIDGLESAPVKGRLGFTYGDALRLSAIFEHDSEVLLWVTLTRVWSCHLHLYYRFREGYRDHRLVEAAPGHLFLAHEKADPQSYLTICVQNGWDFWVLGAEGYGRLFVSHDEYYLANVDVEAAR